MIVRAEFLNGVFYGSDTPIPHPARLFSAMVAAYHDGNGTAEEREALLKIESSPAPEISLPSYSKRRVGIHFVRVNTTKHDLKGRKFPATVVDGPIEYHFNSQVDASVVKRLLDRIPYLGATPSVCHLSLARNPTPPNLFPADNSNSRTVMRIPYRGFLQQLESNFEKNVCSMNQKGVRMHYPKMRRVVYCSRSELPVTSGEFSQLIPVALKGRSLAGTRGPEVAKAFRRALMSVLGDPIPNTISGHESDGTPIKKAHVGFHPMLFSDAAQADGHLMGIGILLPQDLDIAHRFALLKGIKEIETLKTPWREFDVRQFDPAWSLNSSRYTDRSKTWSTVTPIELPCYPRRNKGAHEIVAECVEVSGLPKPANVRVSSNPRIQGGYESKMYHHKRGMLIHATITFDQPVAGPIAIGRGRYLGFGLCINQEKE